MDLKKRRASSSRHQEPYDTSRFVSEITWERYETNVHHKNILLERNVELAYSYYDEFLRSWSVVSGIGISPTRWRITLTWCWLRSSTPTSMTQRIAPLGNAWCGGIWSNIMPPHWTLSWRHRWYSNLGRGTQHTLTSVTFTLTLRLLQPNFVYQGGDLF